MSAKNKLLDVPRPVVKSEWMRWAAARELKYDDAREWLELYDYTLSLEEWENELWDYALAVNEHFDSVTQGQTYEPQRREV